MELQKMGETMVKQRARVLEQHERLRFMIRYWSVICQASAIDIFTFNAVLRPKGSPRPL